MQRFLIGLAGQFGIHVAEIFVRRGIARMRPDRHLERRTGLVVLLLLRVQYRQIVIRLGQLRKVFGQLAEHRHRLRRAAHLGQDKTLEEAPLWILWLAGDISVDLFESLWQLPLFHQALHLRQVVGSEHRDRTAQEQPEEQGQQGCLQRLRRAGEHRCGILGHAAVDVTQAINSSKKCVETKALRRPPCLPGALS